MRFLLDTTAIVDVLRQPGGTVSQRLRTFAPADVATSSIVMHELYYGARRSRRQAHNVDLVDSLLFTVVEFDQDDAREAGRIRAALAASGRSIGPSDLLIAAQAITRSLVLVTSNTGEFNRIRGLEMEDWAR